MSAPVVVVMGVSGSGKTTVGLLLAADLGVAFIDADDLHSPAALAKMAAGVGLTDADRWPWLDRVGSWIAEHHDTGCVVACSALKKSYRDRLRAADPTLRLAYLQVDEAVIDSRLAHRKGHFFPRTLIATQFADLEPPDPSEHAIIVHSGPLPDEIAASLTAALTD